MSFSFNAKITETSPCVNRRVNTEETIRIYSVCF